jgi:hypothetical protein
LNFEAGALAKSVSSSHVVPLAINLRLADIQNPLGQFQGQILDENGMKNILQALNSATQKPLDESMLDKLLIKWWPELHENVEKIKSGPLAQVALVQPERPQREILEELLSTVRGLDRSQREISFRMEEISLQSATTFEPKRSFPRPINSSTQRGFYDLVSKRLGDLVSSDEFATSVGPDNYTIYLKSNMENLLSSRINRMRQDLDKGITVEVRSDYFENNPDPEDGPFSKNPL